MGRDSNLRATYGNNWVVSLRGGEKYSWIGIGTATGQHYTQTGGWQNIPFPWRTTIDVVNNIMGYSYPDVHSDVLGPHAQAQLDQGKLFCYQGDTPSTPSTMESRIGKVYYDTNLKLSAKAYGWYKPEISIYTTQGANPNIGVSGTAEHWLSDEKTMFVLPEPIVVPAGKKVVVPASQPSLSTLHVPFTYKSGYPPHGSFDLTRTGEMSVSVLKDIPANCKNFTALVNRIYPGDNNPYSSTRYPVSQTLVPVAPATSSSVVHQGFNPSDPLKYLPRLVKTSSSIVWDNVFYGPFASRESAALADATAPSTIIPAMQDARNEMDLIISEALAETSNIHTLDVDAVGSEIVGPTTIRGIIFEDPTLLNGSVHHENIAGYAVEENNTNPDISLDFESWIVDA
jgi:hypothetical protein